MAEGGEENYAHKIIEAYTVLSNVDKRKLYDDELICKYRFKMEI